MRPSRLGPWVVAAHLAVWLLPQRTQAAGTDWQCSPEQMYEEIVHSKLKEVDRVEQIPMPVLQGIGISDPNKLANPGERYNAGCVQDDEFPGAVLVFAAQSPHLWVIVTKHGGFVMGVNRWIIDNDGECIRAIETRSSNQDGFSWPTSTREFQKDLRPEWIAPDLRHWQWEAPDSQPISQYDGLRSGEYRLEVTTEGSRATVSVRKAGDFLRAFEFNGRQQLALVDSHLFVTFYSPDSSGTKVAAFNVESGRRIWMTSVSRHTDESEHYVNDGARLTPDGHWLVACGQETSGSYLGILNQKDGSVLGVRARGWEDWLRPRAK
jgi:hypothetical protein